MLYLLGELFVFLLIAFLLGLIFGWGINQLQCARKLKKMENIYRINFLSLEQQLRDANSALQYSQTGHFSTGNEKPDKKNDLKQISGIGPVLEKHLNKLGLYTFQQIANLSKKDLDLISTTLESFPDRIERENWVEQAKLLCNQE